MCPYGYVCQYKVGQKTDNLSGRTGSVVHPIFTLDVSNNRRIIRLDGLCFFNTKAANDC